MRVPDPRPELKRDSRLWEALLSMAYDLPGKEDEYHIYGTLLGLRCYGAAIIWTKTKNSNRWRWVITHGEMDPEEYEADRKQYLEPHAEELAGLMERLLQRFSHDQS